VSDSVAGAEDVDAWTAEDERRNRELGAGAFTELVTSDEKTLVHVYMNLEVHQLPEVSSLTVTEWMHEGAEEENETRAWKRLLQVLANGYSDDSNHYYFTVDALSSHAPQRLAEQMRRWQLECHFVPSAEAD
jgi:hypothetical protein